MMKGVTADPSMFQGRSSLTVGFWMTLIQEQGRRDVIAKAKGRQEGREFPPLFLSVQDLTTDEVSSVTSAIC